MTVEVPRFFNREVAWFLLRYGYAVGWLPSLVLLFVFRESGTAALLAAVVAYLLFPFAVILGSWLGDRLPV